MIFEIYPYTKVLDSKFKEIEGLYWFPFVGKDYFRNSSKILVIGESHYAGIESSYGSEEYDIKANEWRDPESTRQCLIEERYKEYWRNKTYKNISFLLSGSENNPPEGIWNNIAYYNLVQKLLPNMGHRPSYEQFLDGIHMLPDIISLLQPDLCILIGVSSRNAFKNSFSTYNELKTKICNSHPFKIEIKNIQCLALPHISRVGNAGIQTMREIIETEILHGKKVLENIKKKNNRTLSHEKKLQIFSLLWNSVLLEIPKSWPNLELEKLDKIDGTPYFGFKVKDYDFSIAFNFWKTDFQGLTAGFYFPDGLTKIQKEKSREIFTKKDGWKINNNWIYYEVYRLYNWNDLVFKGIEDGSISHVISFILEEFLLPKITQIENLFL